MALQSINLGTVANDGTGDNLRVGADKVNDNFLEVYNLLGDGSTLTAPASTASPTFTGVVSFPDGTAGAPSITNTGDTNTGISFATADQVDISTGGTLRLSVSSTAVTSAVGIVIPDAGNIGSASDTDAIAISSGGDVSLTGGGLSLIDQEKVILGSNSDISLAYDETTTDSLVISSDVDDAALGIILQADAGADAGDEWKLNVANGGVMTLGNDIASAGTHVTLLTITPNSTAASSTHAFIGALSASSTITATGGLLLADGGSIGSASDTNAITISSGGDVALTGGGLSLIDDEKIVLGTNSDIGIKYDETTTDSLVISQDVDGAGLSIVLMADRGDDAGDEWKLAIADGGVMTLGNDKNSAGTHVTMLTVTPHATASSATMAFTGSITAAGNAVATVGTQTAWIPACAMRPTKSNGCAAITDVETTAGRPDMQVLDFDATADEHAQFQISMPKSWNEGTVTFAVYWTTTATDTDGVAWGLQGVAVSDNDTIDVAYGTAVVVTDDALSAAEDLMVTATSSAVTIGGSPAAGDLCFFRIFRDVSDANDDMAEDARLIGVKVFFTTDAANDA